MSRRRSTGDLVPRDISEILAREARAQRGQKKPGNSLGHALSWLKGSRRKKTAGNGPTRTAGSNAKLGLQNQEPAKAGPKANEDHKRLAVHYTTSQHYQENVFIEGSRPQYLEDLHSEAQEGLKIQQQEENKNGVNYPDDESVASTACLHQEPDISSKDKDCSPESESTAENAADTTATSAVSTRPVLTRQGSTFKPLNPVKRADKSKKRNRRTTIMGIPNQVQKELALHRSSTFQPLVPSQPLNQEEQVADSQPGVVIIPTVDGLSPGATKDGARVNLSELEASRSQQLLWSHLQLVYQDEQPFNNKSFGSHLCQSSNLRPKSVAVPGLISSSSFSSSTMLSFLQEPQGPVMSISPQATYMSTIIPNAVLPASVEVIGIDRSNRQTRGSSVNHGSSVRAVSKSSLASADLSVSPLLSRKSDGHLCHAVDSQNASVVMPTSASGSNLSESQSSETVISNPSPASSKRSARSCTSQKVDQNGDQDRASLHSSLSRVSSPSTKSGSVTEPDSESGVTRSVTTDEDAKNKRNSSRSLSITKTKQPPAPPRRTNSLHNNKITINTRVLVESKDLNDSVSRKVETNTENIKEKDEIKLVNLVPSLVSNAAGSPDVASSSSSATRVTSEAGGPADPHPEPSHTSPQKTPLELGKFERTMSPSSGYSSQSGTPTLSPKGISPSSPDKDRSKPVKPERSASRASSSAASPSCSLTSLSSGTSEPISPDVSSHTPSLPQQASPVIVSAKELSPNKTFLNSRAEFRELLNIPPPPKVKAPCPPPPETWVHNKQTFELLCGPCPSANKITQKQDKDFKQRGTQTENSKEMQVLDEKQTIVERPSLSESKVKSGMLLTSHTEGAHMELQDKEGAADVQKQEQSNSTVSSRETTPKKDPPPVMKKPTLVPYRGEAVSTEHTPDKHQGITETSTIKVDSPLENHPAAPGVVILVEMDKSEAESLQSPSAQVPVISKSSPPPTPPPAYHPTPPLSRRTPPSSISMPPDDLQEVQEESPNAESCWPPPPPPLEGDPVFDGADEVDFPPPPPVFVTESVPDVIDLCVTKLDILRPTEEVGQTVEASSKTGATVPGLIADVTPAVTDSGADAVLQVSKGDSADAISCQVNVLEHFPPLPAEAPPSTPITAPENLVTPSALSVSSSCVRSDSIKADDQSPLTLPVSAQLPVPSTIPLAPPLPTESLIHGINFRRQSGAASRDTRSKELLLRHRSAPIPKEDANIPLVTPSLLQMVRLRSVNMTEDPVSTPPEDKTTNEEAAVQDICPLSIKIPQKPIRKSLSLKSPPPTVKTPAVTLSTPSMRLQEAVRIKTAAMSSKDSLPSRLGVRSQNYSYVSDAGALSLKSAEGCDMNQSPASSASFVFSKSTKKEPAAAPSADLSLKQRLAADLMEVSDQSRTAAFSNGGVKCDKVPPPVAKKPAHGNSIHAQIHPGNGAIQVQHTSGITPPETTTRVTADTIETLF
ncbi:uncharacterized protein KIAA1522 homolog isoform X2 [Betta splendens]|uniref:Uncharacterized protein KIAA1522 homolog isoform X2 n=1 Tax=Betta splendens TaxID=158456 RepID=A0A6P7NVV5_BETSP|nr:uncharacterized protein KIAA1522 homolog isoform X2 [Betta splendens]